MEERRGHGSARGAAWARGAARAGGIVAMAVLFGCARDGGPAALGEPIPFCESDVDYVYDPETTFSTFPDDHWTVPDASTATGLRVSMPADHPAFSAYNATFGGMLDQLGTLDGFGLTPPHILRFVYAPATLAPTLLVEEDGGWTPYEVEVETFDHGRGVAVVPWRPLPPGARVVLALRTDPEAEGCISPSPALRALLHPESTEPLATRYAEGLSALGWAPEEVGAMVVYTTQSAEDVDAAVAADVASRTYALDAPATCTDEGPWRDCRGTVTVGDYRVGRVVPDEPVAVRSTYALPVAFWLPPAGTTGPYPTVICGHGLGGSKSQCQFLAEIAAPEGVAVVAVDAQAHGEHPLRTAEGDLEQIMELFGFTISPQSLDALAWRDNFRASAWDKLQVVRAIRLGVDVDGDGTVDLDGERMAYAGASLGGIMGPELLAWADLRGAALAVPGGELTKLILDSDTFGMMGAAISPPDWDEDDIFAAAPLVQTLIDAGDPLVHAAAVTRRRADGAGPHVTLLMAYPDTIVPNSATAALAQAFGVTGLGAELLPIPGVAFQADPLFGNLPDGATGALLQFDETHPSDGAPAEPADHSTLHESEEAAAVMRPFLIEVLAGETPTVADPR